MKRASFEFATPFGPQTAHGWRVTEHFAADVRDDVYWSLTHLPTGRRVCRHRSLEACLRSAEKIEKRCGEKLASTNHVVVAWAISPTRASRYLALEEAAA